MSTPSDAALARPTGTAAGPRLTTLDQLPADSDPVLGLVWFGTAVPATTLPCLHVPLPLLEPASHPADACLGEPRLDSTYRGLRYRADNALLFGMLQLEENSHASQRPSALQQASESAYERIFDLLQQTGYPHLCRTWNYIARINSVEPTGDGELERYRQFNLGRQSAFDRHRQRVETSAPAACALGCSGNGPLHIAFIASRTAPQLIENPRQVSAYHYPREYGPRSPTFSRAALVRSGDQLTLFVSGTASIVGHRSRHLDDVVAQTRETLNNIAALLEQARHQPDAPPDIAFSAMHYRVYLRRPEQLPQVRDAITRAIGPDCDCSYVQADVCRQELLVEIEATGSWTQPAPHRQPGRAQ